MKRAALVAATLTITIFIWVARRHPEADGDHAPRAAHAAQTRAALIGADVNADPDAGADAEFSGRQSIERSPGSVRTQLLTIQAQLQDIHVRLDAVQRAVCLPVDEVEGAVEPASTSRP